MKQRTFLDEKEQWCRTVALGRSISERWPPPDWGLVVVPHRLFRVGDFCLFRVSNGMAQRMPVYAVSSKGYQVRGHYLHYGFLGGALHVLSLPLAGNDDEAAYERLCTCRREYFALHPVR